MGNKSNRAKLKRKTEIHCLKMFISTFTSTFAEHKI